MLRIYRCNNFWVFTKILASGNKLYQKHYACDQQSNRCLQLNYHRKIHALTGAAVKRYVTKVFDKSGYYNVH